MIAAEVAGYTPLIADVVVDPIGKVVVTGVLVQALEEVIQMKRALTGVVGVRKERRELGR